MTAARKGGDDILAACVAASVEQTAFMSTQLLHAVESERNYVAAGLVRLVKTLQSVPDYAMTVHTADAISSVWGEFQRSMDHTRAPHSYTGGAAEYAAAEGFA